MAMNRDYITFGDPEGYIAGGFGPSDHVNLPTIYDHQCYFWFWENWLSGSKKSAILIDLDMSEEFDELMNL